MNRRSVLGRMGIVGVSVLGGGNIALTHCRAQPPRERGARQSDGPNPVRIFTPLQRSRWQEPLDSVAFSPDGSLLAAGGRQLGCLRLVDAAYLDGSGREPRMTARGPSPILHLWDTGTGRVLQEFPAYPADITTVCFSADGSSILTAEDARYVPASDSIRKNTHDFQGSFTGRELILVSEGALVRAWSTNSGFDRRLRLQHDDAVRYLAAGPQHVTIVDDAGNVRAWDTGTGRPVARFTRVAAPPAKRRQTGPVYFSAAISPDANRVLIQADTGPSMRYDLRAGTERRWEVAGDAGYLGIFTPDGNQFITASLPGKPLLWDFETMTPVRALNPEPHVAEPPKRGSATMAFSHDGTKFAYAWTEADGFKVRDVIMHAESWDVATGRFLGAVKAAGSLVRKIGFSPDGGLQVAVGGVEDMEAAGGQRVVPLSIWHVPRR